MAIEGSYFDGRTAVRHKVAIEIRGDELHVSGDGLERRVPIGAVTLKQRVGTAPRWIAFPDGASCEVSDSGGQLLSMFEAGGLKDGVAARWSSDWRCAAGALLLLGLAAVIGYTWAAPWVASAAAPAVPETAVDRLSADTLRLLDTSVFRPTQLPESRREAVVARFAAIAPRGSGRLAWHVQFREGGDAGATAIALPSGVLVVTDQLVRAATSDDEVAGVLAHELGHVQGRHGLRMAMQGSIVTGAMALYLGDFSGVVAAAPVIIAQANYSREFEREADDYAAALLTSHGIPSSRLADILERIDASVARDPGSSPGTRLLHYTASHPDTRERVARLRAPAPGASRAGRR